MREMTLDEIKKTQLEILIYVDKVCKENNIKYSIAYGTLLGAVRHKGFIPWDDDIDILVMRSDYNKLLDVLYQNTNEKNRVYSPKDEGYFYPYAKVSDKDTIIKEKNWPDYDDIGVNIDIFPVDFVSEGKEQEYYDEAKHYENCLHNCLTDIAFVHDKGYMRLIKKICRYRLVKKCRQQDEWYWKNKLDELSRVEDSNEVSCLLAPYYCLWDKSMFENFTEVVFENNTFSAVSDYDKMLKSIYGDYMQLPPESEKISNHDFIAYWK